MHTPDANFYVEPKRYKWETDEEEMYTIWDILVGCGYATDKEIAIATYFGGKTKETLESMLYYLTGYRSLSQFFEYEADTVTYHLGWNWVVES